MLSSLRNKSEAAPATPAWHPNFRNYDRLPDTKAVRTSFFISALTAVVAAVILLFVAYQEYKILTLKRETADWSRRVEVARKPSASAVADFKSFQAREKSVLEVSSFVDRKIVPSNFVHRLGATLPPDIIVDWVDLRATVAVVRGRVRGAPGAASGLASDYVTQLQSDPQIASPFESITLTSLSRNAATEELNFEVQMKMPVAPPPQRGKAPRKK
jgi:hypothetical protein